MYVTHTNVIGALARYKHLSLPEHEFIILFQPGGATKIVATMGNNIILVGILHIIHFLATR